MLTQDWRIRQIETLALAIARIVFQKEGAEYRMSNADCPTDADRLYTGLNLLVREGRIAEAEDLLFQSLEAGARECRGRDGMEVAVDFYFRLNSFSDRVLENGNFSREEIEEGLRDVMERFGIVLP